MKDIKEYRLDNFYLIPKAVNTVTYKTTIHIHMYTHSFKKLYLNNGQNNKESWMKTIM
jgi:hypothetical protein